MPTLFAAGRRGKGASFYEEPPKWLLSPQLRNRINPNFAMVFEERYQSCHCKSHFYLAG